MNSDGVAAGIIKVAAAMAVGWAVMMFLSRYEWVLYLGLALLVACSFVLGISRPSFAMPLAKRARRYAKGTCSSARWAGAALGSARGRGLLL